MSDGTDQQYLIKPSWPIWFYRPEKNIDGLNPCFWCGIWQAWYAWPSAQFSAIFTRSASDGDFLGRWRLTHYPYFIYIVVIILVAGILLHQALWKFVLFLCGFSNVWAHHPMATSSGRWPRCKSGKTYQCKSGKTYRYFYRYHVHNSSRWHFVSTRCVLYRDIVP